MIVSVVASVNDYQKDKQFRGLEDKKNVIDVPVLRDGKQVVVPSTEVVVGDLLQFDAGDKLRADGLFVSGHTVVIDESTLTGESEPVKKSAQQPYCLSGTTVTDGSGTLLVSAVGEDSEWGRNMALITSEPEDTPLQEKLGVLANQIGKCGFICAAACFTVLTIAWIVDNEGFPSEVSKWNEVLNYVMLAVTIVVVAVPEGLPLAVTISLAYSVKKMMSDNNLVRFLAACETMGGATQICSDKTGTLTENRMTVVMGWFAGKKLAQAPTAGDLDANVVTPITRSMALNSKAFLVEKEGDEVEFVGNRTECALLVAARKLGADYKALRAANPVDKIFAFSSERKMRPCWCPRRAATRACTARARRRWSLRSA